MSDLLKEAIADAKAVRETALQNAKMALEEAFTPHLKSMLSAKLAEDDMEDDEEEMAVGQDEIPGEEEDAEAMERMYRDDEMGDDEEEMAVGQDEIPGDIPPAMEPEDEEGEEDVVEINGVKYARVMSEEDDVVDDEGDDEGENLDLEAVIKELENEIAEQDDAYDEKAPADRDGLAEEDDAYDEKAPADRDGLAEEEGDEKDDDEEVKTEQSDSSDIGKGDNALDAADGNDEEDPQGANNNVNESVESLHAQLNEYKEAVTFLRDKLHEVNILNAKLLYTNRLFKEYVLSNDQKMKVVETFDRAQTTREIKLVYSTLAESFNDRETVVKKNGIKENASRKTGTTAPKKKIISEEDNVANRFKKLAGILKD